MPVPFLDYTIIGPKDHGEVFSAVENSTFKGDWEYFAVKLRIKEHICNEIRKDYNHSSKACLREILKHWLAKGEACDYEVCNKICHHLQYTFSPYNKCILFIINC